MNSTFKKAIIGLPIVIICSLMAIFVSASAANAMEAVSVDNEESMVATEEGAVQGINKAEESSPEMTALSDEPEVSAKAPQFVDVGNVYSANLSLTGDDYYLVGFKATHKSMVITLVAGTAGIEALLVDETGEVPDSKENDSYIITKAGIVGWRYDNLTVGETYGMLIVRDPLSPETVECPIKYRIAPANISKYTAQVGDRTYNGKAGKPVVNLYYKYKSGVLSSDAKTAEYTITTSSKAVGPAKATLKAKYPFIGTKTIKYGIYPKGTKIKSISRGKKSFTVKWNKQATQTTGYQVRYSLKKSMAGSKKITVNGKTKVSRKVTGLKAKKTYYVQVRSFKLVGRTRYCSAWSPKKTVKTK